MKKKAVAIILVAVVLLLLGAYVIFDNIFPKAEPIKQLDSGLLESVSIYDNENDEMVLGDVELQKLINCINGAVPTRVMSVNDYPGARPYYVIEIKTEERILRYIIYKENGTSYVEIPYEGVYEIDKEAVDILK